MADTIAANKAPSQLVPCLTELGDDTYKAACIKHGPMFNYAHFFIVKKERGIIKNTNCNALSDISVMVPMYQELLGK